MPSNDLSRQSQFKAAPLRTPLDNRPGSYWDDIENRRAFLLDFAKKMEFDPTVADNWRYQRYNLAAKGVSKSLA